MSVMEISHRSKTFEDLMHKAQRRHPRARERSRQLQDPDAAGRRQPAVLDGADEPARRRARPPTTSTPDRGPTRRSRKRRRSARSTSPRRPRPTTTRAFPTQRELKLTPGAAYVHMTSNNTIEGHAVEVAAATSATRRSSATRPPDMFSGPIDVGAARADLRRRAEEPRSVRRHAGHHPRGSARALGRRRCRRC